MWCYVVFCGAMWCYVVFCGDIRIVMLTMLCGAMWCYVVLCGVLNDKVPSESSTIMIVLVSAGETTFLSPLISLSQIIGTCE